jgi:hypothetical protein
LALVIFSQGVSHFCLGQLRPWSSSLSLHLGWQVHVTMPGLFVEIGVSLISFALVAFKPQSSRSLPP